MKILIIGVNGQVGHALKRTLEDNELISLTRQDCDLIEPDQIKRIIDHYKPNLIINSAAYTKVDQAEIEKDLAFKINRDAPKVIAAKAHEHKIPLIHFSTDYVFDGSKEGFYHEEDETHPLGIYGESKLAGEEAINVIGGKFYILRTAWIYSNIGHNFYLTMKRLSHDKDQIRVVGDQFGTPTSNLFIARQIKKIIPQLSNENTGTYNLVPDGSCSWYTFAKTIFEKMNSGYNFDYLLKIKTSEFPVKAKRPKNSILSNEKIKRTFMLKFDNWESELDRIMNEA